MIVKMTLEYQIDIKIISNSTWEFVFGPHKYMDVLVCRWDGSFRPFFLGVTRITFSSAVRTTPLDHRLCEWHGQWAILPASRFA